MIGLLFFIYAIIGMQVLLNSPIFKAIQLQPLAGPYIITLVITVIFYDRKDQWPDVRSPINLNGG